MASPPRCSRSLPALRGAFCSAATEDPPRRAWPAKGRRLEAHRQRIAGRERQRHGAHGRGYTLRVAAVLEHRTHGQRKHGSLPRRIAARRAGAARAAIDPCRRGAVGDRHRLLESLAHDRALDPPRPRHGLGSVRLALALLRSGRDRRDPDLADRALHAQVPRAAVSHRPDEAASDAASAPTAALSEMRPPRRRSSRPDLISPTNPKPRWISAVYSCTSAALAPIFVQAASAESTPPTPTRGNAPSTRR